MNKQKHPGLFLKIAGVLLVLSLVSVHFTTGLYARYTTRAQGSDKARVAEFSVALTDVEGPKKLGSDLTGTYTFTVKNNSEVAVQFAADLSVKDGVKILPPAADAGTATEVKDDAQPQPLTLTVVGSKLTINYQKPTQLAPGASTEVTVTLAFDADTFIKYAGGVIDDKSGTFLNTDMSSLTGSFPFEVNVTFVQIN